jgi:uncharacterized protein involved in exopolysaccharide biosynthesis
MSEQYSQQPGQHQKATEDEISLLDLAVTLAKHKKLILGLPIFAALVAAVFTFFIPNTYVAATKLLPLAGDASKQAAVISLIRSQAMADSLIRRLRLQEAYGMKRVTDARVRLMTASKAELDKDGLIDITVKDTDPRRAADIANTYVVFVSPMLHNNGLTEVSHRRLMLEKQLPDIKEAVLKAESALTQARQQLGAVIPDAQVTALVKASSELRSKIAMKEMELLAMGSDATKNSDYLQNMHELNRLWNELSSVDDSPLIDGRISDKDRDYLHKIGDLEYNQTHYDQLLKQIEKAKLDEISENFALQVLDRAEVPVRKSEPKRLQIVLFSALAAGFAAILAAFMMEVIDKAKDGKESSVKMQQLIRYLRWKQ